MRPRQSGGQKEHVCSFVEKASMYEARNLLMLGVFVCNSSRNRAFYAGGGTEQGNR